MKYNPDVHHRRSIRLKDFDYSSEGAYFITICTENRENLFGGIIVGADSISAQMKINDAGKMIELIWKQTIIEYQNIKSEKYVIMPNHFHCIIDVLRADMESAPTVGSIVQSFKRNTTVNYINGVKSGIYPQFDKRIWQRNYYEHIIRDKYDYQTKWNYIDENPQNWEKDEYR